VRVEFSKVSDGGRCEFDSVGQGSGSWLSHELMQRDSALFLCLSQGRACVLDVDSIHFLAGQAFQQAKIFNRNDSGQVLPSTGYNGPLFPEGRPVNQIGELVTCFGNIDAGHRYESYKPYNYIQYGLRCRASQLQDSGLRGRLVEQLPIGSQNVEGG